MTKELTPDFEDELRWLISKYHNGTWDSMGELIKILRKVAEEEHDHLMDDMSGRRD